ncbi:MAG: hypothetical protein OEY56_07230 [Cyclobacteriaceae bacterium]|nr:hypothetical protein [Cyclobacteriaceae bacterium]
MTVSKAKIASIFHFGDESSRVPRGWYYLGNDLHGKMKKTGSGPCVAAGSNTAGIPGRAWAVSSPTNNRY